MMGYSFVLLSLTGRKFIGWRVDAVGGVPVADAERKAAELVSSDTEMGKRQLAPLYLAMPEILQALGLSGRHDSAVLTLSRGSQKQTVTIPAGEVDPLWPPDTDIALTTQSGWVDACRGPTPLYLQAPLQAHRLVDLPLKKAVYAQLNWVADTRYAVPRSIRSAHPHASPPIQPA